MAEVFQLNTVDVGFPLRGELQLGAEPGQITACRIQIAYCSVTYLTFGGTERGN